MRFTSYQFWAEGQCFLYLGFSKHLTLNFQDITSASDDRAYDTQIAENKFQVRVNETRVLGTDDGWMLYSVSKAVCVFC